MAPLSRADFRTAIFCAKPCEANAIDTLFDEVYDRFSIHYGRHLGDGNAYVNGRLGRHEVVLCCLPQQGGRTAAAAAASLRSSYPNIELALVVGVCGGVPFVPPNKTEIILGDVILSNHIVEYDAFRRDLELRERLGRPSLELQGFFAGLAMRISQKMLKERMRHYLAVLEAEEDSPWIHPGSASDVLFPASLRHKHHREYKHASCRCYSCYRSEDPVCDTALKEDCDSVGCSGPTIPRKRLAVKGPDPAIHIGNIACADVVMKSGTHRDELAKEEGIIGFEMESAGVAGVFPCVVVKGVCDYADSHKNERWQDYAAGTAACCVKAFLELWSSSSSSSSSQPQPRGPLHQASSPEYESNWELLPERPIKLLTAGSREGSGYGHLDHEVSKYRERI